MKPPITLSQAVAGYLLDARARHLSIHTIADYTNSFRKLQVFLGEDPPLASITPDDIRKFLADLATPRAPAGIAPRPIRPLSKKTVLNIHTGLSALWTWAVHEHIIPHQIIRDIGRPKPERPVIVPFTQDDVRRLLAVCDRTRPYTRPGQRISDNARPAALRDRAIILVLLDTGVRASELCDLRLRHCDLRNSRITVMGKGSKERDLPLGPSTTKALWRYITVIRDLTEATTDDRVFLGRGNRPMTRHALQKLLLRLGARAEVPDCHPHRFRHTFAITYLRNGGNTLALQACMGHETMEMVAIYATIAQADIENGHKLASPIENWRL